MNLLVSLVRAGVGREGTRGVYHSPTHPLPKRFVGGVDVNGEVNELVQATLCSKPLREGPASLG